MDKEAIQELILSSIPGQDYRVRIEKDRVRAIRKTIERAERKGYKVCLSFLYDDTYYFEKRKEGNKGEYMASLRKRRACKNGTEMRAK